jgi:biopolymer transport protein TolR
LAGSANASEKDGIYEVNMTPLIDVSLVLVVILLVATPMAFQSSIGLNNVAASGRTAPQMARAERVELAILSEDSVRVNRAIVARGRLEQMLVPLLAETATRQVVVRCDDRVSHGAFVSVIDDAKRCGAAQIAVIGR